MKTIFDIAAELNDNQNLNTTGYIEKTIDWMQYELIVKDNS